MSAEKSQRDVAKDPSAGRHDEAGSAREDYAIKKQLDSTDNPVNFQDGEEKGTLHEPESPTKVPFTVYSHGQTASIIVLVSFLAMISPLSSTIYLPALTSIANDMNVSITLINLTVTTYMIFQGIAPSFIGNFSDSYGRRPAYIICCVLYLSANIGLALQNSYPALLVLRCLQSCGSSATITLGSATAADMVTRAERGKYLGYSAMGVTLGPALGPVIGGLLDQYLGWRSIFWFLTIFSGVMFLVVFSLLPETCRAVVGNGSIKPQRWNMSLLQLLREHRAKQADGAPNSQAEPPRRKRSNPFASLIMFGNKTTGTLLSFGAVAYGGYYLVLTTLSTQLSERLGYSSVIIGVCFLPMGIGTICYRYTAGYLMDWNFRRHMKKAGIEWDKNHQQDLNILPIERMRLEVSMPFMYLGCAMIIVYGWVLEKKLSLAAIEVTLFFLAVFLTGALNNINTLLVDLHADTAATAVAANNLARCLSGAGAAAIGPPMINRLGMGWTSVVIAAIWVAGTPLLWLVALRGQSWRAEERREKEKTKTKETE